MAVLLRVQSLTPSAPGKVTAVVVVEPSAFASFRIDITVDDAGNRNHNLQQVEAALRRFAQQWLEALDQGLRIAP
jgi:hypothetical protein